MDLMTCQPGTSRTFQHRQPGLDQLGRKLWSILSHPRNGLCHPRPCPLYTSISADLIIIVFKHEKTLVGGEKLKQIHPRRSGWSPDRENVLKISEL